jgi:hypothetical protein
MSKPEGYRARATEVTQLATAAIDPDERRRLQEREAALTRLADNEQWVIENHDKTLHAPVNPDRIDLTADEEHVVTCLGMAVIMQWNMLSTGLQRELFDNAGSLGGLEQADALRGLIARFLHKHKDSAEHIAPGNHPRPGMGAA